VNVAFEAENVGSTLDTWLDCYTAEISHCEQFCNTGLAF